MFTHTIWNLAAFLFADGYCLAATSLSATGVASPQEIHDEVALDISF